MVEYVAWEKVQRGLMANASSVVSSKMRVEILSSKKEESVIILGVIHRYEEKMFVRENH